MQCVKMDKSKWLTQEKNTNKKRKRTFHLPPHTHTHTLQFNSSSRLESSTTTFPHFCINKFINAHSTDNAMHSLRFIQGFYKGTDAHPAHIKHIHPTENLYHL